MMAHNCCKQGRFDFLAISQKLIEICNFEKRFKRERDLKKIHFLDIYLIYLLLFFNVEMAQKRLASQAHFFTSTYYLKRLQKIKL